MDCDRTILVPDATAIVQDQDGNELARENIASGATGVIPVNVGGGVLYTYPYDSFNTGQDVSYATGDDKDIRDTVFAPEIAAQEASGLLLVYPRLSQTDPTKLVWGSNPDGSGTNIFGNLERFTNINGLSADNDDYFIDHLTGMGIYFGRTRTNRTFFDFLLFANSLINSSYSDFHAGNAKQLLTVLNNIQISNSAFNYSPFNFSLDNSTLTSTTIIRGGNLEVLRNVTNAYLLTVTSQTTSSLSLDIAFRKAFTYNPTTKQMDLT